MRDISLSKLHEFHNLDKKIAIRILIVNNHKHYTYKI